MHQLHRQPKCYLQGCKPDTDRLTERAAAAAQAWSALQASGALLLCSGYASQAGRSAVALRSAGIC